jgi:glycosyltransferase involved in cell wall biosynthesis
VQVAILTANARRNDAIGNQVAEKLAFFLDRGADVRVYVHDRVRLHPALESRCHEVTATDPHGPEWTYLTSSDLVVVEYGQDCPLFQLLPLIADAKPRLVFCYYGITPPSLWGPQHRESLENSLANRGSAWCADTVLTTSRFAMKELCESTGLPEERIRLLPLPVDTDTFTPDAPRACLRKELGISDGVLILFVGRVAPNKRLSVLIDALPLMQKPGRPAHAVIVGDHADVYEHEMQRCLDRAGELGVADRVHFRGQLPIERLQDAYRSADVLVMPSLHEGFCVPVVEAMASGLPVVAARSSALPETLGGAGLTFAPDDASDLAQKIDRVITPTAKARPTPNRRRIAVVSLRYGDDFVGGAERSLRLMAEALHEAGHPVEVFTTSVRREDGIDELPEGTVTIGGIPVHRFRIDALDRDRWNSVVRSIAGADGDVSDETEREFLRHSLHSTALVEMLHHRRNDFDVVIAGPFALGLVADVAKAFGEKVMLVPCFHDEPTARLRIWHDVYDHVSGMLFHSPEEQLLAQAVLGFGVPGGGCVGTWIDMAQTGDPLRGREYVGTALPYVVYAGRFIAEKGVQQLLDFAARYSQGHPDRLRFVFMGEGNVRVPNESWAMDLGFVSERVKRDVVAGACALINLSPNESLSLAALEAWAASVPVIASEACPVMKGHIHRGGGAVLVGSYESFHAALDELLGEPKQWRNTGVEGRDYVAAQFGSKSRFVDRLQQLISELDKPLAARLKARGLERAHQMSRHHWRQAFGGVVEKVLDEPPSLRHEEVLVEPRLENRVVAVGSKTSLVPVRVVNRGALPALQDGPARHVIRATITGRGAADSMDTSLPALLLPGKSLTLAAVVPVPAAFGEHELQISAIRADRDGPPASQPHGTTVRLTVTSADSVSVGGCLAEMVMEVQRCLSEAQRFQTLPDDYVDVTQGRFAKWKAWIKRKLLGNFKNAYVDVLSRRQSEFNRRVLAVLNELVECCTTLESALRESSKSPLDNTIAPSSHRQFTSSHRVRP